MLQKSICKWNIPIITYFNANESGKRTSKDMEQMDDKWWQLDFLNNTLEMISNYHYSRNTYIVTHSIRDRIFLKPDRTGQLLFVF